MRFCIAGPYLKCQTMIEVRRLSPRIRSETCAAMSDLSEPAKLADDHLQLRAVLDAISEGYVLLDNDFTILDVNAETLRLESRSREELIGQSHWEAYPDSENAPLGLLYKRAMQERVNVSLEHCHEWDDGRRSWLEMRAFPVGDDKLAVFFREVTDRHSAAQELTESEQRFRGAIEAFADALWTNDAEGRMAGEQPGWAALTGQSFDEYQGYGWSNAVHPDDAQPTVDAWQQAVAERQLFSFEHRVRRQDGAWRRFSIRAAPVFDADGSLREWVGVHTDITDLRASETRFRQLAESIDAVFYISEIDEGRVTYVSPAYEKIWQRSAAELYADPTAFLGTIHPDDHAKIEHALRRQFKGEATEMRYRLLKPDGDVRYIHDRAFLARDPDSSLRRVVGIAEDVTDTTNVRLQLARNAETFESLVRDNPFGIYVIDSDFKLAQFSAGAAELFAGIEPLIGRDFAEILRIIWQEPFASEAKGVFRNTLATGESFTSHHSEEPRANAEGTSAFDWRLERIALPDGRLGVVCYFYDLTERRALEEELRRALSDKDLLLREIDHRVRNSLTMVSSLLSMQAASASSDVDAALSVAASRIQAVARIHERLYKGADIGIVEFGTYLEEICHDLRRSLHHGDITLTVSTVAVGLPVNQAVPLGLIANELITNAFKHCTHENATISIAMSVSGDNLQLVVSDDGIGMPADYSPTDNRGLGMKVVELLVHQLSGTIELPVAGGTARFCIAVNIRSLAGPL